MDSCSYVIMSKDICHHSVYLHATQKDIWIGCLQTTNVKAEKNKSDLFKMLYVTEMPCRKQTLECLENPPVETINKSPYICFLMNARIMNIILLSVSPSQTPSPDWPCIKSLSFCSIFFVICQGNKCYCGVILYY